MADSTKKGSWSEAEKLGLLFQIIERGGTIPWNDLELPEGRTLKAAQMMIQKEKDKVKKARGAQGNSESGEATPTSKTKRAGDGDDEESPSKKKPKTPRKKKAVKGGGEEEKGVDDEEAVKPEPDDDDLA